MKKELLMNLHEEFEFKILLTELKSMRPIVPAYDCKNENSVEEWKVNSTRQQMFDTMMSVIDPFKLN